jgi:Zn-dependent alcohol dehydrogenase
VIGLGRRNFLVPMPRFESFEALNASLEEQCRKRQDAVLRGHTETIGERLMRDLDALMALPAVPYDACEKLSTRVSSISMVRYRGNDYSVPVAYAHHEVQVRGYGTAEKMLHRAGVASGTRVLIAGASGGVGSAAVQLAKRRGAEVIAIAGRAKIDQVRAIGADHVIERDADPLAVLGTESADVVVDNVAGRGFGAMLDVLKRSGNYVSSGAIGGPLVQLDMRTFYLKDLNLIGCTAWDEPVFPNLLSYIERGEIRPLLAKTFPLDQIAAAQREFLEKAHVGKFVLIPPPIGS